MVKVREAEPLPEQTALVRTRPSGRFSGVTRRREPEARSTALRVNSAADGDGGGLEAGGEGGVAGVHAGRAHADRDGGGAVVQLADGVAVGPDLEAVRGDDVLEGALRLRSGQAPATVRLPANLPWPLPSRVAPGLTWPMPTRPLEPRTVRALRLRSGQAGWY